MLGRVTKQVKTDKIIKHRSNNFVVPGISLEDWMNTTIKSLMNFIFIRHTTKNFTKHLKHLLSSHLWHILGQFMFAVPSSCARTWKMGIKTKFHKFCTTIVSNFYQNIYLNLFHLTSLWVWCNHRNRLNRMKSRGNTWNQEK